MFQLPNFELQLLLNVWPKRHVAQELLQQEVSSLHRCKLAIGVGLVQPDFWDVSFAGSY